MNGSPTEWISMKILSRMYLLSLLERAIAVDVCLSVCLSVKRVHPDKTK